MAIIVNSLIKLGRDLGITVIAEGIEVEEHLQFLINNDCLLGQGNYLSKPLTAEEMTQLIHSQKKVLNSIQTHATSLKK